MIWDHFAAEGFVSVSQMGYPQELAQFKFDASFAIRGLIFDKQLGNLVKVSVANESEVLHLLHFTHSATPLATSWWCGTGS